MECTVCLEVFDQVERRPKVLPCGHTLCLRCLQNPAVKNLCPQDRLSFEGDPMTLPDNFALLAVVAEASADGVCCDVCRRLVSGEDCPDAGRRSHSQRRAAQQQPAPGVAELRRELRNELQELRRAVLQPGACETELRSGLEELRNGLDELRRSVQRLELQVQGQQLRGAQPPRLAARLELDVEEMCRNRGLRRERNSLLLEDRLTQVQKLTGLDCGVDVAWAEAVLHKVGPHVEVLRVTNVDLQHLRAIQGMSALKHLYLDCSGLGAEAAVPLLPLQLEKLTVKDVRREHLLSLQWMPKLRVLFLTSIARIPLTFSPVPDHCGIQNMALSLRDTETLLSLVRAHATTIVTLMVGMPSAQGYPLFHHPNLPRRLHQCGLVALRRLHLLRIRTSHDEASCSVQLGHFRARFGRDVDVLCSLCDI